jgi:hypothetical protein
LRRFLALSAAIALNIRPRVGMTVATPFDRMACKVKSWLSAKYPDNFLNIHDGFVCLVLSLVLCLVAHNEVVLRTLAHHKTLENTQGTIGHSFLYGLADHSGGPWFC